MVIQLNNIEGLKIRRKKHIGEPLPKNEGGSRSVSQLVSKYSGHCFNQRNQNLGSLIKTTDRIQKNNKDQIMLLHKILDRVELDRPYLFKDKIAMVANSTVSHRSLSPKVTDSASERSTEEKAQADLPLRDG